MLTVTELLFECIKLLKIQIDRYNKNCGEDPFKTRKYKT